jgi:hypothetical protein
MRNKTPPEERQWEQQKVSRIKYDRDLLPSLPHSVRLWVVVIVWEIILA